MPIAAMLHVGKDCAAIVTHYKANVHRNFCQIFAILIALGSWWGLLVAAISLPLLIVRILDEERALAAELAGYENYRRAVPYRLILLVW